MSLRHQLMITADYPPRPGGQARYLGDLWGGLSPARATVLGPRVHGNGTDARPVGPRVLRARLPLGGGVASRVLRTILLAVHAMRVARRLEVRAVHAGQIMASGAAALVCRKICGCPYTVVVHGADLLEFSGHPLAGRLARRILAGAACVIANSRFTAAAVAELGVDRGKIRVLYPMVDADRFSADCAGAALRARHGIAGRTVMLTVARLVPRKGHDTVLAALPAVLRHQPDTHWLVVGDGPSRAALERRATRLGVRDHVTFVGFVPEPELPAYYAAADLFVMVSRDRAAHGDVEGFGIVYLEAAAAGKAVLAGDSGGVVDAVEDEVSGLLVDPDSVDDVAAGLVRLLGDLELRNRLARAGRRRVRELFSLERGRAAFAEVLDELAGAQN